MKMGKTGRDWTQIYAIYGIDDWQTPVFLLIHAILFSFLSIIILLYFPPICLFFESIPSNLPSGTTRFAIGFIGSVTAISAVCLYLAACNIFYSSVYLQWEMAQRMVTTIEDWSSIHQALVIGCSRGILLNSVAMQLKKCGSSGRVVGIDSGKSTVVSALQTARIEGVEEFVTCREGDGRRLPFGDGYFDIVTSAMFLHRVGKELGRSSVGAAAERMRVVGEVVRVLKPGGIGVVWDLVHVGEYVKKLKEMKMEEIRVSERVTAFMVSSHIVSFRRPRQQVTNMGEDVRLDWRFCNIDL
ncbi:uncharacterized protein LOC124922364 [Impatiens glandulifera]|uniref:uncharacterized protein LOC124922364 n=1 Tax=Impatiens glandulifera TaxID=253017 RepID=UPI001FB05C72|nr:uncharacterized protein LOC124922364 [Impatiens glandulifera]